MNDLGTYLEHDGRPAVRFERLLAHPVDRVWRAVTEPGELAHWFPSTVRHESRAGGPIVFSGDPYADDTTGVVLVWDPPHRFSFAWGDDELHLELTEVDGGCRLMLVDVLEARDAAARNASGWYVCLAELDEALAGMPGGGPHGESSTPFAPVYDAHLAAGLPSGAEIPEPSA